jgi:hypothetical protein
MDGYEVVTAEDGVAALELLCRRTLRSHPDRAAGCSAGQYRPALRSAGSRIPVIMVSTRPRTPTPPRIVGEISAAIPKPPARPLSRRPSAAAPTAAGKTMSRREPNFGRLTNRKENRSIRHEAGGALSLAFVITV